MKVDALETTLVEIPLPKPVGTAIHQMRSVGCVLTTIRTTDGVTGEGFAFTGNAERLGAFDEMIRGLSPYVVGQDVRDVEKIWHDIWRAINPIGQKGVTISALSAIDVALWDVFGKRVEQPLAKLFGGMRDRVDTYASSGLWLNHSIEEIVTEAREFVEQGFAGMKVRVGGTSAADDERRVQAVRDAVGADIDLYVDVNQGLTPKAAIRLGRRLEQFDLVWIEEPVAAHDLIGHREVRTALDTPVASGETEYTRFGMQAMLDARAADILMPDLQRIGGFSEFRRAAAAASACNIGVSSHFFTEYSLAMAGSIANCISVEHIDWFAPLFNESPEIEGGRLVVPNRPGTGFTFDQESIIHHQV